MNRHAIIAGIAVIVAGGAVAGSSVFTHQTGPAPQLEAVRLNQFSSTRQFFEPTVKASFVVRNDNPFPVRNVEITCFHGSDSGEVVDRTITVLGDVVPGKGQASYTHLNLGPVVHKATRATCRVTSLSRDVQTLF